MNRFAFACVVMIGCAAAPPRPSPAVPPAAADLPQQIARDDLDARLARGDLVRLQPLLLVDREHEGRDEPPLRQGDQLVLTHGEPRGWHWLVFADAQHRLWLGREPGHGVSPPPGGDGPLYTTRALEAHYEMPRGYTIGGRFDIVEPR